VFFNYVLFLLLLISPVQAWGQEDTKDYGKEATYYQTDDPLFKKTVNVKFGFWFDIPKDWKAIDKSETGDGYYIVTGDDNVDMRIYGSQKVFSDSEYFKMLLAEGGKLTDFKFRDEAMGKRIETYGKIYFLRTEENIRITLYLSAKEKWFHQNKEIVEKIARSIKLGNKD